MTGRQDEPGARWDSEQGSSDATPNPNAEAAGSGARPEHSMPDYGAGSGTSATPGGDPAAGANPDRSAPNPPGDAGTYQQSGVPGGTPPPQQVPGQPYSGPNPVVPPYMNPAASGPQQVPGAEQYRMQSGPHQTPGGSSGAHQVWGGQSGPYPAPPGQQPYPPQGYPQGYPQPQQGQSFPAQQPAPGQQDPALGQDLSSAQLVRQAKRPPQSGWRRAVYLASGKTINPGESPADVRRRELIGRINQPLQGCYKIAMLSLKGGVGKTTTTATLGSTFSSLRGDRVIAVDANPDRGTLGQKIPMETTATVRHLLRDAQRIRKYSDVRSYTSQGPSRLEVLASEQDPAVSEAFSESDYHTTVSLLEHFYNMVLTDCGTGLMHSAMKGVLDVADSLVIVSPGSVDGARSASATLDWLDAHGYGELVARSVAVINSVRPGSGKVDVDKLAAHFGARCRSVSRIPFDAHLEEGAEVDLDQLAAPTRLALLELAATVADDFPHAAGRQ
ncbi:AAA family ATPase [Actinopolyspora halophila]|uniref:AAA family ATPase n=1 Tax=Actinopolyspora halophila TaxID=1850 RepID=UPI00035EF495|nr:AAA family ATPase [Actinopolyspora halophila]